MPRGDPSSSAAHAWYVAAASRRGLGALRFILPSGGLPRPRPGSGTIIGGGRGGGSSPSRVRVAFVPPRRRPLDGRQINSPVVVLGRRPRRRARRGELALEVGLRLRLPRRLLRGAVPRARARPLRGRPRR